MQAASQRMRNRVVRKFARVPAQHGDMYTPAFYPITINPGFWGTPWAKVKDAKGQTIFTFFVVIPVVAYIGYKYHLLGRMRVMKMGKRPGWTHAFFRYIDLDDPDYFIRREEFLKEVEENKLEVRWNGSNFMAGAQWQPGDPEPDIRRKEIPHGHH
eukprot:GILI01015472.1.p1 GENE.GILI01015472.1~~GILI01015472.1.p1  ORF type:complete len:156 (-),score=24.48 GILI01015472.1:207-674(-)